MPDLLQFEIEMYVGRLLSIKTPRVFIAAVIGLGVFLAAVVVLCVLRVNGPNVVAAHIREVMRSLDLALGRGTGLPTNGIDRNAAISAAETLLRKSGSITPRERYSYNAKQVDGVWVVVVSKDSHEPGADLIVFFGKGGKAPTIIGGQ